MASKSYGLTASHLYITNHATAPNGLGTTLGSTVGRWNGSKNDAQGGWTAIGSTLSGSSSRVTVICAVSDNEVYIGGKFTGIDGVSANNIILWRGNGFVSLGSGINGEVEQIVYDPVLDRIYVSAFSVSLFLIRTQRLRYCTLARNAQGLVTGGSWAGDILGGRLNVVTSLETDGLGNLFVGGSSLLNSSFHRYNGPAGTWGPTVLISGLLGSLTESGTAQNSCANSM